MTSQPAAILIAGANGAGKTTFARQFLRVRYPGAKFLNADEIQREGAGFAHPVAAGRELLRRPTSSQVSARRSQSRRPCPVAATSSDCEVGPVLATRPACTSSSCRRQTTR